MIFGARLRINFLLIHPIFCLIRHSSTPCWDIKIHFPKISSIFSLCSSFRMFSNKLEGGLKFCNRVTARCSSTRLSVFLLDLPPIDQKLRNSWEYFSRVTRSIILLVFCWPFENLARLSDSSISKILKYYIDNSLLIMKSIIPKIVVHFFLKSVNIIFVYIIIKSDSNVTQLFRSPIKWCFANYMVQPSTKKN